MYKKMKQKERKKGIYKGKKMKGNTMVLSVRRLVKYHCYSQCKLLKTLGIFHICLDSSKSKQFWSKVRSVLPNNILLIFI